MVRLEEAAAAAAAAAPTQGASAAAVAATREALEISVGSKSMVGSLMMVGVMRKRLGRKVPTKLMIQSSELSCS